MVIHGVVPLSSLGLDKDVTASAKATHMPLAAPIKFGEESATGSSMVHGLAEAIIPWESERAGFALGFDARTFDVGWADIVGQDGLARLADDCGVIADI